MIGDMYIAQTDYSPPIPLRIKPEWYSRLTDDYRAILDEVYQAIDSQLFFLSSAGTRTALDQLIVEQIGDVGTFKDKIAKLVQSKVIDDVEGKMLLAVLDAGSASAHRSYKPEPKTVNHMMDILEAIFHKLLIEPSKKKELEQKAEELRRATPKRNAAGN